MKHEKGVRFETNRTFRNILPTFVNSCELGADLLQNS